jgi:hypothetical protein
MSAAQRAGHQAQIAAATGSGQARRWLADRLKKAALRSDLNGPLGGVGQP